MTLDGLGSVPNPVMDVQANIRSINEEDIKIGLYDRKPLVNNSNLTYLSSPHLRNAGKDFKTIETHYTKLHDAYEKKKIKSSELKERMMNQMKKWDEHDKNNRKIVVNLKETVSNLEEKIYKLEKANEKQSQEIKNLISVIEEKEKNIKELNEEKNLMLKQIDDKDRDKRQAISENNRLRETIEEQAAEIRQLKSVSSNDAMELGIMEEIELKPKPLEEPFLPDDGMGRARNLSIGLKYTLCESDFPTRKRQNDLRKYAYDNDKRNLKLLLSNEDKETIINGRGAPDSIGSRFRFWYDKTPLMLATKQGNVGCVKTLLKKGAKVNYLDRDGKTALDYVGNHDNSDEIYNILRGYGAEKGIYFKKIFKLIEDHEERKSNQNEEMINSF